MAAGTSTLKIKNSCENVIKSVRESQLNYSIQETPHSLYFTVRKTFARSSQVPSQNSSQTLPNLAFPQVESLKMKLESLEISNEALRASYVEAVDDSELCHAKLKELENIIQKKDEVINTLKSDKEKVEKAVDVAEKNWKELNKENKVKDKEVQNLKKENESVAHNLEKVRNELKNITSIVNKEKKTEAKKLKKDEKKEIIAALKAKPDEIQCDQCEVKLDSWAKLKQHERTIHMTNSSTQTSDIQYDDKNVQAYVSKLLEEKNMQTENALKTDHTEELINSKEYEKYSCFYCEKDIASEAFLLEHSVACHGATEKPSLFSFPVRLGLFFYNVPSVDWWQVMKQS